MTDSPICTHGAHARTHTRELNAKTRHNPSFDQTRHGEESLWKLKLSLID